MARFALLGAMAALGMGLAACGGGGDSQQDEGGGDAKQGFVAEANRVCTDGPRKLTKLYLERGIPANQPAQYAFDRELVTIREEFLAGLRRLDPPADKQKVYRRYLSLRKTALDLTKGLVAADRKGDEGAAAAVDAKLERTLRRSLKTAGQVGLDVCAQKLSADDATAVTAVISDYEVTADPQRACRDLATSQFINSRFPGGYAQCAAYVRQNAGTYAKSVDVSHVEGTNGVVAVVDYKDVGGSAAGVPASATLYQVGGRWKIFSAQEEQAAG